MNQKELTKTFMMILNWKTPFGFHGLCKKYFRALRVKRQHDNANASSKIIKINPCAAKTVYIRFQANFRQNKIPLRCVTYLVVDAQLI